MLGRRYQEVPVVGSSLTLRITGRGKLVGVKKLWRPIKGEQGTVAVTASDLVRRLETQLRAARFLKPEESVENDITILGSACGYIEGPVGNEQLMMGPGAIVSFRRRTAGSMDQPSQVAVPLADYDFPILGTGKYYNEPK